MTQASNSNEWKTARPLFLRWHALYKFDVDAFAAKWNAQLPRFWTKATDAFAQDSKDLACFGNPPYSAGNKPRCMTHARNQVLDHGAKLWGMHIPANTSEGWWTDTVARAPPKLPLVHVEALELPGFANGYRRIWGDRFAIDLWFYEGRCTHTQRNGSGESARFANAFVVFAQPKHLPDLRSHVSPAWHLAG